MTLSVRLSSLALSVVAIFFCNTTVNAENTSDPPMVAQPEEPHGSADRYRHRHEQGGRRGFGRRFRPVPPWPPSQELAEILLLSNLTAAQKSRLQNLYIGHCQHIRENAKDLMAELPKTQLDHGRPLKMKGNSPSTGLGEEILAGLVNDEDSNFEREPRSKQSGFKHDPRFRSKLKVMMTENIKFCQDMLAVLSVKQRHELQDIEKKSGSPDYFIELEKIKTEQENIKAAKLENIETAKQENIEPTKLQQH